VKHKINNNRGWMTRNCSKLLFHKNILQENSDKKNRAKSNTVGSPFRDTFRDSARRSIMLRGFSPDVFKEKLCATVQSMVTYVSACVVPRVLHIQRGGQ
jgi:hypothetical protein